MDNFSKILEQMQQGNKMTARVAPTSKARNGDTVRVAFDPHKVHLFDIETELTILN